MLSGKLPTGTVDGGRADDTRSDSSEARRRMRADGPPPRDDERVAGLESEVESLRRELDDCRREKREIIDRYESLLRAMERDSVADGSAERRSVTATRSIESRLRRLLGR